MSTSSTGGGNQRIVAHLIVRDAVRFAQQMHRAAESIDEVGDAADSTDRKLEKTDRNNRRRAGGWRKHAKDVRGFGSSLIFTEKKITSFAITAGVYLAPAIVALGNSAAAAAVGGGLVAGGGLAALGVGLGGLSIIGAQAKGHVDKVTTAMDAAQLAVLQYGRNSDEAAHAATHLSAVIDQQGGPIVYKVIKSYRQLGKEWTNLTKAAEGDLFRTFYQGLRGARRLLPQFAATTNQAATAVRANATMAFNQLSGAEIRGTIKDLGDVFANMSGPASRGAVNAIIVIARLLRNAAPYAVGWAKSFEDLTWSWRRGTHDTRRLRANIADLVDHFNAWVGFGRAILRTMMILFGASNDEGKDFVRTLTGLVEQFNDWLAFKESTGEVSAFFANWIHGIKTVGEWIGLLFTDQSKAATEAGNFFADLASHAFAAFLKAWWNMDWSGKLFTGLYLASKLGIFNTLGSAAATRFMGAMGRSEAAGAAGEVAGMSLGKRLAMGVIAGLLLVDPISEYIKQKFPSLAQYSGKEGWAELGRDIMHDIISVGKGATNTGGGPGAGAIASAAQGNQPLGHYTGPVRAKAGGGMIPMGAFAMVGERGPEWALATSAGIGVMPIRSQLHAEPTPVDTGRDLSSSDHERPRITQLVVNGRVLAEVVDRARADKKARRGEDT